MIDEECTRDAAVAAIRQVCSRCTGDDVFADVVTSSLDESVRILILTDCCHSGSIADLDNECWHGRQAVSITGCLDEQTSGDIGRGGIFTHSMLMAVSNLQQRGESG